MQMGLLHHRRKAGCTPQDGPTEDMLCSVVGVGMSMHRLCHQNSLTDGLRTCTPPPIGQSHMTDVHQTQKHTHDVIADSLVGMKLLSHEVVADSVMSWSRPSQNGTAKLCKNALCCINLVMLCRG